MTRGRESGASLMAPEELAESSNPNPNPNHSNPSISHQNLRRRATPSSHAMEDSYSKIIESPDVSSEGSAIEMSSNGEGKSWISNGDGDCKEETNSHERGEKKGLIRDSEDRGLGTSNGDHKADDSANVPVNFRFRVAAPAHRRIKESPLSSDAIFKQSHAGLFNLCIVVLVAVNGRLIIENLLKYGLLIRSGFWFSSWSLRDWPLFMCCLTLPVFPLCAFVVEKLAQHKLISEPVIVSLHVMITTAAIMYPIFVILRCDSAVLFGLTLMLFACTVWLKLVSYAHTNYDIRALNKLDNKGDASFNFSNLECSQDINLWNMAYFMVAPTLCYQPSYPRNTCVRKGLLIRQFVKLVIFTGFMSFIIEQYINPIVQNSQHPLKGDILNAIERVLKLSVPTLYVWLCMFYCLFHLWLNILAEVLRFGDREFYKDWWNAKTIEEYWKMWNMPVHKWMVRHIYCPCLQNGIPKGVAVLIAFFLSAVFHELCIGIPCHMFKLWAFIGMMIQVPLVLLTNYLQNKFRNPMVGNMIFWFLFCILGQPMSILLYYHDLMNKKVRAE